MKPAELSIEAYGTKLYTRPKPGRFGPIVDLGAFKDTVRGRLRGATATLGVALTVGVAGISLFFVGNTVALLAGVISTGLGFVGTLMAVGGYSEVAADKQWLREQSTAQLIQWLEKYWYLKVAPTAFNADKVVDLLHNTDQVKLPFLDRYGRRFTVVGGDAPYKLLDYSGAGLTSRAMDAAEKIAPYEVTRPKKPTTTKESTSVTQAIASLNKVGRESFFEAEKLHARLAGCSNASVEQQHIVSRAGDIIQDCKILLAKLADAQQADEQQALDNIMHALAGATKMLREIDSREKENLVRETAVLARYASSFDQPENKTLRLS